MILLVTLHSTIMLQGLMKVRIDFFLLSILFWAVCAGCGSDTSTNSADESAYMADYEAPENKWGFMDTTGQIIIKPVYDDVSSFSEGYAAVNKNGKWGFIDRTGKVVIQPQFKSAWAFQEGLARIKPFDQPEQFIASSGKKIASTEWVASADFSGGLAKVRVGSTYGYIDTTGKLIIPAIYDRAWDFKAGLAVIGHDGLLGLIDTNGTEVLPAYYNKVKLLDKENLVLCNLPDTGIVFDLSGNRLVQIPDAILMESNGKIVSVRKDGKTYFFDLATKAMKSQSSWSNVVYLGETRWAGKNEMGYVLLDAEGRTLSRKTYSQLNKFVNGLAAYHKTSAWGYMDINGVEQTVDVFGLAWDYKEGFARAAFADGIAFLDRNQKLAFYPPIGTLDMRDFSEGRAPVQVTGQQN